MGADDIPYLFGYLAENGYTIQTDLTKMMNKSPVQIGGISSRRVSGNREMICIVEQSKVPLIA